MRVKKLKDMFSHCYELVVFSTERIQNVVLNKL